MYSVRCGRECGVFDDLTKLKDAIVNFKGAEFNEFKTLMDADAYLALYSQVYGELLMPQMKTDQVVMQFFFQPVGDNLISSVSCFNSPFIALSTKVQRESMMLVCLHEFLIRLQNDKTLHNKPLKIYIGAYNAESCTDMTQPVCYPQSTTPATGLPQQFIDTIVKRDMENVFVQNLNAEDKDRLSKIIDLIHAKDAQFTFETTNTNSTSYAVRIPMFYASQLIQQHMKNEANKQKQDQLSVKDVETKGN